MLTQGFTIVDYQATPSGYYQIAFRDAEGQTIVATQHGRGGSNLYSYPPQHPIHVAFTKWLDDNASLAVGYLEKIGFPDLAQVVKERGMEWEDSVVMSICDLIDMGKIRIAG
jgi:hypothetical protein